MQNSFHLDRASAEVGMEVDPNKLVTFKASHKHGRTYDQFEFLILLGSIFRQLTICSDARRPIEAQKMRTWNG
jgi:hypothetical protein